MPILSSDWGAQTWRNLTGHSLNKWGVRGKPRSFWSTKGFFFFLFFLFLSFIYQLHWDATGNKFSITCLDKMTFLKKKSTHSIWNVFSVLKMFSSPHSLGTAICILTRFLFIFLKLLHIFFFMESKTLWICHLFVCFMRKHFIETRFKTSFFQEFL